MVAFAVNCDNIVHKYATTVWLSQAEQATAVAAVVPSCIMRYKPYSSSRLPILSSRARVSTNHFQFHWNINVRTVFAFPRASRRIADVLAFYLYCVFDSLLHIHVEWAERACVRRWIYAAEYILFLSIGGFTVCFEPLPPLSTWVQTIWIECDAGDEEEVEERNKIETPIHSSILPHTQDGQATLYSFSVLCLCVRCSFLFFIVAELPLLWRQLGMCVLRCVYIIAVVVVCHV